MSKYPAASISETLDGAYNSALARYNHELDCDGADLPESFLVHVEKISNESERCSAAFTNIITGIATKLAFPELDVRFHQTQIQEQSRVGKSWFTHRGISEDIVYPWLNNHDFAGAKSGWQTRTLERPKPYTRAYEENIARVKEPFLEIYEGTEELSLEEINASLVYLIHKQIILREKKDIDLATPSIDEISHIISHLEAHISAPYEGKGASRLPVLALFATLKLVCGEITRYKSLKLKDLEEHSAADSQTGSAGDIEFEDSSGSIFEAIEVKHNIPVTQTLLEDVERKVSPFQLNRYYVLTTHQDCKPAEEITNLLRQIKQRIGCQIIVNGIYPTIQYYLRLVTEPQSFYREYTRLLREDRAVTHEHRETWNRIILQQPAN